MLVSILFEGATNAHRTFVIILAQLKSDHHSIYRTLGKSEAFPLSSSALATEKATVA